MHGFTEEDEPGEHRLERRPSAPPEKRVFTFSTDGGPRSQATGFSERRYESLSYQVEQLLLIHRANEKAPKGAAELLSRNSILDENNRRWMHRSQNNSQSFCKKE